MLTEQAFVRVGGVRQVRVDVRVVSSTSKNLEKEIAELEKDSAKDSELGPAPGYS